MKRRRCIIVAYVYACLRACVVFCLSVFCCCSTVSERTSFFKGSTGHCRAAVPRLNESAVDFVARTEKKEVVTCNETADGILVNLHLRHVAIVV